MARGSLVLGLFLAAFLYGCSATITLRNDPIQIKETAELGQPAVFFLDKVAVPVLNHDRIGKVRAISDAQWSWVYTKSDLSAWADGEWAEFFRRHGQTMVMDPKKSDYKVLCTVVNIYVEKFNAVKGANKFASHVVMRVTITNSKNGQAVYARELKKSLSFTLTEAQQSLGDEAVYNHCLSAVFQSCLEQIQLR